MNNIDFANSFSFGKYRFSYRQTDHSDGLLGNYIVVMKEGNGKIITAGETVYVEKGDFLFIPDRCKYVSRWTGNPVVEFDTFVFPFFPERSLKPGLQKVKGTDEMLELYTKIADTRSADCYSIGVLYQILGIMLPMMESKDESKHEKLIGAAISYMKDNVHLSVKEIADKLMVSESSFYAAFKDITGLTPVKMRQRMQVEKAIDLLISTDMTVQAISETVGFNSPQYFRKVLLKETGKTPKVIRRELSKYSL